MKNIFKYFLILTALLITFASCKKAGDQILFEGGTPPVLTSNLTGATPIIPLSKANKDQVAVKLFWTNPDYKFTTGVSSQDVTYLLEIDTAGANFARATKKQISLAKDLSYSFTQGDLNDYLIGMKLDTTKQHTIEMRVSASLSNSATKLASNILTFKVKPYSVKIIYPAIYVPGDYQGWAPDVAPSLMSLGFDEKYEGFVYINPGSLEFKFTSAPDWGHTNYGDAGSGKLSTSGGAGNLKVPSAGYYWLKGDTKNLTWSATKTDWGLLGSAVPTTGWDSDRDMTYDPATKTWKITLDLVAGEIKFRANDAWDINFGDKKPADNILDMGSDNIVIGSSGNYTITLNLSKADNYTYIIKKN
ncbi:hypothetical protein BH09BAC2_BH09BAC2_05710 [soil metagenome]